MSQLSFLLFWRVSHFNSSKNASHTTSFITMGSQTVLPYSRIGRTILLKAASFTFLRAREQISSQESKSSIGLGTHISNMRVLLQITSNCYTEVFDAFNLFQGQYPLVYTKPGFCYAFLSAASCYEFSLPWLSLAMLSAR